MACVSDVGQWHLTHSAVPRGSRAMNCSSTTRSTTSSTSRGSAMSHLRQASWSCWAITNGRLVAGWPTWDHRRPGGSLQVAVGLPPALPPSAAGPGAPTIGCAPSRTPPLSSQRGPRRPPGHPVDPSSSAGRGRWMGLRQGCPSGQASSGGPAGLHPARKRSSCSSFMSISAWCCVWWRPARDFTSSASGVGWAEFLVPGFGTSVARFKIGWKDEEVRGGEQTVSLMTF